MYLWPDVNVVSSPPSPILQQQLAAPSDHTTVPIARALSLSLAQSLSFHVRAVCMYECDIHSTHIHTLCSTHYV